MAIVTGNAGSRPVLAQVYLSANLNPWDGSALPFDHVSYDPGGLWDATNHQFVSKVKGWYQAALWANQSSGFGIQSSGGVQIENSGTGDNIKTVLHSTEGPWVILPAGFTHLRVGDALFVSGSAGSVVDIGTTFSLLLVVAD